MVGLTDAERALLNLLGEAWNQFCLLPAGHPSDASEFKAAIHAAQNIVAARLAMRMNPETLRQPEARP